MKLAKYLEFILLGLSAVLIVVFFVMPHETASDAIVDTYLYWAYALVVIAVVTLLGFALAKTFSTKKGILNLVLLLVGVVVLVGVSYFLAPGTPAPTSVKATPGELKLTDTIIILTYILIGASIVSLLGTTILKAIKNR